MSKMPSTDFIDEELPDFAAEEAEMKKKLGQSTWYFLHTMAAKYPVKADEATKERMRNFYDIFSKVYPCSECSAHFQELLAGNPPQVRCLSRSNYSLKFFSNSY